MLQQLSTKTVALVRDLPKTFAKHAIRSDQAKIISESLAKSQHKRYCDILETILGKGNVVTVPTRNELPDSLFVEDTVVVLRNSKHAIGLNIGVQERRAESMDVWDSLSEKFGFHVHRAKSDKETLDGGDVLFTGSSYIVGLSKRTNVLGAKRFAQIVGQVQPSKNVEFILVPYGLHLKSICSICGPGCVVVAKDVNESFLNNLKAKSNLEVLLVPDAEAANCLYITRGDSKHLILREDYPKSTAIIRAKSLSLGVNEIYECNMSEIAKADGALTCCSILLDV
jgi:dimethylargininase